MEREQADAGAEGRVREVERRQWVAADLPDDEVGDTAVKRAVGEVARGAANDQPKATRGLALADRVFRR